MIDLSESSIWLCESVSKIEPSSLKCIPYSIYYIIPLFIAVGIIGVLIGYSYIKIFRRKKMSEESAETDKEFMEDFNERLEINDKEFSIEKDGVEEDE